MVPKVQILSLASSLPDKRLLSVDLEKQINKYSKNVILPEGIIEILTGVKERRVAMDNINASDLAVNAAKKALKRAKLKKSDIDCLIFASAGGDIMEPATANIVQEKLQLSCPVFDVKNACNSFVNGIEIAESLISNGKYKKVLITNGEVPSRGVRKSVNGRDQLRRSFAGYTLGDAGAAMILGKSKGKRGILFSQFNTYGSHWRQSTVMGGGTMYPRDVDKSYFEGETAGLKDIFVEIGPKQFYTTIKKVGWKMDDINKIIVHQVSLKTFDLVCEVAKFPKEKLVIVLPELGNMVSASIPVALDIAQQSGALQKGDKIVLVGLAAGVSIGTIALVW